MSLGASMVHCIWLALLSKTSQTCAPLVLTNTTHNIHDRFSMMPTLSLLLPCTQVGKIKTLKGRMLMRSLSLICAKTVILPVLITILLSALKETEYTASDGTSYHLNLFGFIVGTFPTAPGVFSYAMEYNVDPEDTASALVLGWCHLAKGHANSLACAAACTAPCSRLRPTHPFARTQERCSQRRSCSSRPKWPPLT